MPELTASVHNSAGSLSNISLQHPDFDQTLNVRSHSFIRITFIVMAHMYMDIIETVAS